MTSEITLEPASFCKLTDSVVAAYKTISAGFPIPAYRITPIGNVKALMLFVEFNDVKSSDDLIASSATFTNGMVKFYSQASYGKLDFSFDVFPEIVHINTDFYKEQTNFTNPQYPTVGDPWKLFHDALTVADPSVDFSKYSAVYVIPPSSITAIVDGPSLGSADPLNYYALSADGAVMNGAVGGTPWSVQEDGRWTWLAHETGHLLGLPHNYSHTGINDPVQSSWGIMDGNPTQMSDFLGWTKWLEGWLEDSQVRCLDISKIGSEPTTHLLSPIERTSSDTKLIVIRLNSTQAISVEVRRSEGADSVPLESEGVLVHLIDQTKNPDRGIFTLVQPKVGPSGPGAPVGTLQPATNTVPTGMRDFVVISGIQIKVLHSDVKGDLIQISRP